jgi:hypothetical protein
VTTYELCELLTWNVRESVLELPTETDENDNSGGRI